MIVSESDILSAALDRRLLVDRVVPAAAAFANGSDGARTAPQADTVFRPGALAQQFPVGLQVDARTVDIAQPGQVIVELGALRLALAWPPGAGPIPRLGDAVALRVVANTPDLLFEDASIDEQVESTDAPTRLSVAARSLQTRTARASDVTRFTAPILKLDVEGPEARTASSASSGVPRETVGASRAERPTEPGVVAPLLLQGPAWPGQEIELVVHREREDEAFDNPALDRWCGDLVIDLPTLGRVSGRLAWSVQGLRIRLEGQDAAGVDAMTGTAPDLARALAQVDLPVLALSVGRSHAIAPAEPS